MSVTEIRSFTKFLAWLRGPGGSGQWFGRAGFRARSLLGSRPSLWRFLDGGRTAALPARFARGYSRVRGAAVVEQHLCAAYLPVFPQRQHADLLYDQRRCLGVTARLVCATIEE